MAVHIYVGPTLPRKAIEREFPRACIHPPVMHGDLLALDISASDTVLIIDGFFHQHASVRHKEVLYLLSQGIRVIGCSSMGALRAAELADFGMVGIGHVFDSYRSGHIEADDEVALVHEPDGEYRSFSIPLVNIRYACRMAVARSEVSKVAADEIVSRFAELPYQDRVWPMVEQQTTQYSDLVATISHLKAQMSHDPSIADVKQSDALAALRFIAANPVSPESVSVELVEQEWFTTYLAQWLARDSRVSDSIGVDRLSVIQWRQLYDTDFPRIWSRLRKRLGAQSDKRDGTSVPRPRATGQGPLDFMTPETRHLFFDDHAEKTSAKWIAVHRHFREVFGHDLENKFTVAFIDRHLSKIWDCTSGSLEYCASDRGFRNIDHARSVVQKYLIGYLHDRGADF